MSQAENCIKEIEQLLSSELYAIAVNRIYYGIFYSLLALSLKHDFNTSKHAGLIGWFNKNFIANGIIEKRFGKIAHQAFQNRIKGDYDAFIEFKKEEVHMMYMDMISFIKTVNELLEKNE